MEKVTGLAGLSSNVAHPFTTASRSFISSDMGLEIVDTPGLNCRENRLERMLHIARALSQEAVTLLLLVVQAQGRVSWVLNEIEQCLGRFVELLPVDHCAVCITGADRDPVMDFVDLRAALLGKVRDYLGIDSGSCIFAHRSQTGEELSREIATLCQGRKPVQIEMDARRFLECFSILSSLAARRSVREEVAALQRQVDAFMRMGHEDIDMLCSFHSHIWDEISKAVLRVATEHHYALLEGPSYMDELGHLVQLTNGFRDVLSQVRARMLARHRDCGPLDIRQCPHCSTPWLNEDACDSLTPCGSRTFERDGPEVIGDFSFSDDGHDLKVESERSRVAQVHTEGPGVGCGKPLCWSEMRPVSLSPELWERRDDVSTADLPPVPRQAMAAFDRYYQEQVKNLAALMNQHHVE